MPRKKVIPTAFKRPSVAFNPVSSKNKPPIKTSPVLRDQRLTPAKPPIKNRITSPVVPSDRKFSVRSPAKSTAARFKKK